jgi:hypothetical protein
VNVPPMSMPARWLFSEFNLCTSILSGHQSINWKSVR